MPMLACIRYTQPKSVTVKSERLSLRFLTFEMLARNIFLNNLTNNICIIPIALSYKLGSSQKHIVSTEWGEYYQLSESLMVGMVKRFSKF